VYKRQNYDNDGNDDDNNEKNQKKKKSSSTTGGLAKTCKAIGAFSALAMTTAVCFVGSQLYPCANADLSFANISEHLQSYLLVDLPNGNFKPQLPDESDLLPIDADGNFILPGGGNETASSSILPTPHSKVSSSPSSSVSSDADLDNDEEVLDEKVLNMGEFVEADIGEKEDSFSSTKKVAEKKSSFSSFLKSKSKEEEEEKEEEFVRAD
ncbi:hypothetical protein, partial [Pseudomonas aeruginosa]|uniref:hypothetical protein n=1 Tax=Pseudomonas aeruginosa TaxID=287 RepID=UPI0013C4B311